VVAKKFAVWSEGMAEGGCGGNSAMPERNQKVDSPAVLLEEAGHHRKILFSLKEKEIRRAQNEKSKEYFSVVGRAERATAGLASLVGVLRKMSSDFFKQTPPNLISQRSCLGASRLGIGFRQEIPRFFEIHRQHSRREAAVPKRSLDCAKSARADERFSEIVGVSAVQFNHAIL
ncbi:MAG: hypothetical protein KGJ58_02505, partial [Patescibacteria group bacterium]|nr:hypothetical protein [Patescibacteria group bacterium]MDE2218299.1 hypothetical protein [Patescibacteria group bacterium]